MTLTQASARGAQTEVRLDAATITLSNGTLSFQFEAQGGSSADFELHQAGHLGDPAAWSTTAHTTIEAVTEDRYRATLPAPTDGTAFLRIRRTGAPPPAPAPVLNEVMSDNVSTYATGDGRHLDWVELYNPHEDAVRLEGLFLTGDSGQATPWPFPALLLQPGAFLLVHATDDPGASPVPGGLLAPFALRHAGETLTLTDAFGRELDRLVIPPLEPDQSIGRAPDGALRWTFFTRAQATPGRTNSTVTSGVVVAPPEFSEAGGFYPTALEVQISTPHPGAVIRYTTDGSPVTSTSSLAAGPVALSRTTVLRAVAWDQEGTPSEETARTFFIGERSRLPVISLALPPGHLAFRDGYLFGMSSRVVNTRGEVLQNYPFSGSNAWQDREAEVFLEMFEPEGTPALRQRAGLKVYGGWGSRGYPQKSLALLARRQYGAGSFQHEIFPGTGLESFESLVLRNSGNDNQSTHQIPPRPPITEFGPTKAYGSYFVNGTFTLMRDGLMQHLLAGHTRLDRQAYRPAVVYVNGEYWGLYNLREKLSEHHVLAHHELPRQSIDLIEGYGDPRAGDANAYRALRDFVNSKSMAVETNFLHVANTWLEIDNFIDYHLAVIFFQNFDIGNIKCWRPRTPHGRFRWMVYDQDYGFGLWPAAIYEPAMARDYADYENMFRFSTAGTGTSTGWPNAGGRTLLLRRLLANPGFRDRFIRRATDLLNTAFHETRVAAAIDQLAEVIRPEIPAHLQRWSWAELSQRGYGAPYQAEYQPFTAATWETNLLVLHEFARRRPALVREHCAEHFNLTGGSGRLRLEIQPPGAGKVQLNSLLVTNSAWEGIYFSQLTNQLLAVAQPGFRVLGWTTPEGPATTPSLTASTTRDTTRTWVAEFEPMPAGTSPTAPLVVTELNYHSPDNIDADDWIELHNPGSASVNLQGWVVRDEQDDVACVLPNFRLGPGAYCVVARSIPKFQWAHPNAADPVAEFSFGLNNAGDTVRLFDPVGVEVQRIPYRDESPWPTAADGDGSTLQRVMPPLDPSSPGAWIASPTRGGTPGAP
ncbi:MAG: CotH kinase family protein [Verrucomicrobiales bacterium]|nr:CotH kinase family protein [Verrucomicrobiales bacterium]